MIRPRVLVVDDDPKILRLMETFLEDVDCDIASAEDGESALNEIENSTPDLVLLDYQMPGMDGFEVCRRIKADPRTRLIPVVMVTSRAGDKHRRKALDLGSSGYVVKPYQDEALLKVIRHLVRESRSRPVVHRVRRA